ncbi:hypothetical protein [Gemmata sp.]|uniref:hypothetical protein n=1 Tax=Gemmata sp. TaxID=1914242 RepID=UPI003F708088
MNLRARIEKLEAIPAPVSEDEVDRLLLDIDEAARLDPEAGLAAVLDKHPDVLTEKENVRFLLAVSRRRQLREDAAARTT